MKKIVKIVIVDVIRTDKAIPSSFAQEVVEEMRTYLKRGEMVKLSFKGVTSMVINFTCSLIMPLYREFPDQIKEIIENFEGLDSLKEFAKSELDHAIYLAENPKVFEIDMKIANDLFLNWEEIKHEVRNEMYG